MENKEGTIDRSQFILKLGNSSERKDFSAELYYYVIKLENDLKERERTISEISSENKTLSRLLKVTEEELSKKRIDEINHQKKEFAAEQQIRELEEQLKALTSQIYELQSENKLLLQVQKVNNNLQCFNSLFSLK